VRALPAIRVAARLRLVGQVLLTSGSVGCLAVGALPASRGRRPSMQLLHTLRRHQHVAFRVLARVPRPPQASLHLLAVPCNALVATMRLRAVEVS